MKFLIFVHISQFLGAIAFGAVVTALSMHMQESQPLLTSVNIMQMSIVELSNQEI